MRRRGNDLSKAELLSIQKGLEDIKKGKVHRMQDGESLDDFLEHIGHVSNEGSS